MKTDSVWVSTIELDSSNVQTHLGFDPEEPARVALAEDRAPTPDELPLTTFAEYADAAVGDLPRFFAGGGAYVLSGEIADVFFEFNLEETLILPLRVFEHDRKTEVFCERKYHAIMRHNVFRALAPTESPNLKPNPYDDPPRNWSMPWEPKDGVVAAHDVALDGPEVWHDPQLMSVNFYNGKIVKALQDAGFAHFFRFVKYRIV